MVDGNFEPSIAGPVGTLSDTACVGPTGVVCVTGCTESFDAPGAGWGNAAGGSFSTTTVAGAGGAFGGRSFGNERHRLFDLLRGVLGGRRIRHRLCLHLRDRSCHQTERHGKSERN